MTPIEIMAFIAAIIVPIKIIMLLRSQKSWFNTVTRRFWGNAVYTQVKWCKNVFNTLLISVRAVPDLRYPLCYTL